jgi:hypothetical protein
MAGIRSWAKRAEIAFHIRMGNRVRKKKKTKESEAEKEGLREGHTGYKRLETPGHFCMLDDSGTALIVLIILTPLIPATIARIFIPTLPLCVSRTTVAVCRTVIFQISTNSPDSIPEISDTLTNSRHNFWQRARSKHDQNDGQYDDKFERTNGRHGEDSGVR